MTGHLQFCWDANGVMFCDSNIELEGTYDAETSVYQINQVGHPDWGFVLKKES